MKTKRRICLLLIFSIILSMTPSLHVNVTSNEDDIGANVSMGNEGENSTGESGPIMLSNSGPNEVEYTRKIPEIAILNRYTGNSADFYNTLTYSSSGFNAIRLFGKTVDSRLYADSVEDSVYLAPLTYTGFADDDNVLFSLHTVKNNLEIGVSGTFHNNWHTHSVGYRFIQQADGEAVTLTPETFDIMSYSGMNLKLDGKVLIKQDGNKKNNETNPRIGNGEFVALKHNYNSKWLELLITQSAVYYDDFAQCCMCDGHYIDKPVVAFRDQWEPVVEEIWINGVNPYGKTFVFKKGDTIDIEIKYDEPIRFADDSPIGKEDLYVKLAIDGIIEGKEESIHPRAKLVKLENDSLYFTYTVPQDYNSTYTISKIDISPLMGKNIPLKHVGPVAQYSKVTDPIFGKEYDVVSGWVDGSFDVRVPNDVKGNALGFTESSCYITDLAGNPLKNEVISCTFYIDTQDLAITDITPYFETIGHDVKAMLGKTDPTASDYLDNSDTHMGRNSYFWFDITFNKSFDVDRQYNGLIAITNMLDKDGNPIILKSYRAYHSAIRENQEGDEENSIISWITSIGFYPSQPFTCEDTDGVLRIKSIGYAEGAEPLKDKLGNEFTALNPVPQDLMRRTVFLDSDKALVTTPLNLQDGQAVYSPQPIEINGDTRAFRFPFIVEDNKGVNPSGVNGLRGAFRWLVLDDSISKVPWPFKYIITTELELDGTEEWLDGYTGYQKYSFTQIEGKTHYIYIRPLVGQEYTLFDTALQFGVVDYASNSYVWNDWLSFPIDTTWEDQAPSAIAGDVKQSLNDNNTGTIEVDIDIQDQAALEEAYYLWNDSEEPPESEDNSAWIPAPIEFIPDNQTKIGRIIARATVTEGSSFSQHLWVKVFDKSGNQITSNMGVYDYDLTHFSYAISYSSKITSKASLKADEIDDGGFLLFMVKVPDTSDEYYVRVMGDNLIDTGSEIHREAFKKSASSFIDSTLKDSPWTRMKVTVENGKYTYELIEPDDRSYIYSITDSDNSFNGNLQVTVLSGYEEAFEFHRYSGRIEYPLQAGTESHFVAKETVTLRVSHNTESKDTDTFPNISFEPVKAINIKPGEENKTSYWLRDTEPSMLSTAEGVEFNVDLGSDKYGWNYEDIDFANSYIEIELINTYPYVQHRAYLSSGQHHKVVFPYDDYKAGNYSVTLYVKCFAGKDYAIPLKDSEGKDIVMHIDGSKTPDFKLNTISYTPGPLGNIYSNSFYSHGIGEENYYDSDNASLDNSGVIYIPSHLASAPNVLTVGVDNHGDISQYTVRVWNVTTGEKVEDARYSYSTIHEIPGERYFYLTLWDTDAEANAEKGIEKLLGDVYISNLGLLRNKDNIIAIQVLNRNGIDSEVKYYTIHPVDMDIKGSTSVSQGEEGSSVVDTGYIIFTPDQGQLMDGVRLFATAIEYGSANKKGDPREMAAQYDGTYTCPLTEGNNEYYVYSIDKYGNVTLYDREEGTYNDILDPPIAILDKTPPIVTALDSSQGEGMFEAVFKIEDHSIYAVDHTKLKRPTVYMPLALSLYYDTDYSKVLKLQDYMSLDLVINSKEGDYVWTSTDRSPTGIYEVKVERKTDVVNAAPYDPHYLEVTVKGAVAYIDKDAKHTFSLYMDAIDALGNNSVGYGDENYVAQNYVTINDAKGGQPRAYTVGDGIDKEPVLDYVRTPSFVGSYPEEKLILKFNMPVLPESSWINPEPQYGRVQIGAFPVTEDGIEDIKFYDVFGNSFTQTIDFNGVFDDMGMAVDISPNELTAGDVKVIVSTERVSSTGGIILYKKVGENLIPISDDEATNYVATDRKEITLTDNEQLVACHYKNFKYYEDVVEWDALTSAYLVDINISNISKSAPEAKAHFYFTETGREYTKEDLPVGNTTGKVVVRYSTSRRVTPTGASDKEHTFRYGESDKYTFTYVDDLGQNGSLRVDLGELGITIVEPSAQSKIEKDEDNPLVNLNIYAKRSDRYLAANAFNAYAKEEDIKTIFDSITYVQGYLFEVNVLDSSEYKIVVKKDQPQGDLSYNTLVSDSVTGVSISGRNITILPELTEDFYILVIDNAKEETGADKDNYTYTKIKASYMIPWFDTITPTVITETVSKTLYEKTLYITFSDKANADSNTETGFVSLISPKLEKVVGATGELEKYNGWYKLEFSDNSSQVLVFSDLAGNRSTYNLGISDIDTSKPLLKVVWSPSYFLLDEEIDETRPTLGPINTDLKAIISSNMPMANIMPLEYTLDYVTWDEWSYFSPYTKGISFSPSLFRDNYYDVYDQLIVAFSGESGGVVGIRLGISSYNSQQSEVLLILPEGVIDKIAPEIDLNVKYSKREGYNTPYSAEITLIPNEPSYCLNTGTPDILYDAFNPLVIKTASDEKITYKFRDKAGNIGSVSVDLNPIDTSPPILKTLPENTSNLPSTGLAEITIEVNEDCTIKWEKDFELQLSANTQRTLTFTDNGAYLIKAFDSAGNMALATVVIGNVDKTAPMISFDTMTIKVRQDSDLSDFEALLKLGVNVWDNLDKASDLESRLTYNLNGGEDFEKLDLKVPGLYKIPYSVTDSAGNIGYANRYVRVIDKNQPLVTINDTVTEANGTSVLSKGTYNLKVEGLKLISTNEMEPYTIKICSGIRTEGQMKNFASSVEVDGDGNITLSETGFYTLYIITQSRQSYLTLLYVER